MDFFVCVSVIVLLPIYFLILKGKQYTEHWPTEMTDKLSHIVCQFIGHFPVYQCFVSVYEYFFFWETIWEPHRTPCFLPRLLVHFPMPLNHLGCRGLKLRSRNLVQSCHVGSRSPQASAVTRVLRRCALAGATIRSRVRNGAPWHGMQAFQMT